MTTSEDSGQIQVDGDVIRYTSTTYSDWTIPIGDIRIIGEATNQNGPFADDYFLCFATGPELWYEASFYADGRAAFLVELSARLGATLALRLGSSADFASRILWPGELVGKAHVQIRGNATKNHAWPSSWINRRWQTTMAGGDARPRPCRPASW